MSFLRSVSLVIVFATWVGCAHTKPGALGLATRYKPQDLLAQTCRIGAGASKIEGTVGMRVKSPEASGQFAASIQAIAPDQVHLEVLEPFGGTLATVDVRGGTYLIDVPEHPERNQRGSNVWAGIPLNWATELFLGEIPCPSQKRIAASSVRITPEDELIVEAKDGSEKFIYRYRDEHGSFWPEALSWEAKASTAAAVDFRFYNPQKKFAMSPEKWEAKSSRGEVKVLWRDRVLR